MPVKRMYDTSN